MGLEITKRVWEQSRQIGGKRLILLALAEHADGDGVCWPGLDRLAAMTRLSRRHVMRSLEVLEESGELYIRRGGGRGKTHLYFIAIGFEQHEVVEILTTRLGIEPAEAHAVAAQIGDTRQKGDISDKIGEGEKGDILSEKGDILSENGDILTVNGDTVSPESLESPSNHHEHRGDSSRVEFEALFGPTKTQEKPDPPHSDGEWRERVLETER